MASATVFFLEPEVAGSVRVRNRHQIEQEQSHLRSHVARWSHRVRKQKPSSSHKQNQRSQHHVGAQYNDQTQPAVHHSHGHTIDARRIAFYPDDTISEARSLAFFRQKTAVEWSVWKDTDFWTNFITQVSFVSSALRHALIGIAACYESYETSNQDRKDFLRQMSIAQGQKALRCFNQEYANLSISAILTTYIGISAFSARVHHGAHAHIVALQQEFYDQLKMSTTGSTDKTYINRYLEPMIERQTSRSAHFLDLPWNLAQTPTEYFRPTVDVFVPNRFPDLKNVRDVLEAILNLAAYEAKLNNEKTQELSPATAFLLQQWYEALQTYRGTGTLSEESIQSLKVLHAYARINVIMIQTMDSESEIVFDEYTDAYSELADTFEEFVQFEKRNQRKAINFGADGCFITLIDQTATRWCREPSVRRKLIRLLYECDRAEGFETANTWGVVADGLREIEEAGIFPPSTSCHEVPAEKRIRMVRALFYFDPDILEIRYVRPYLDNGGAEEVCFLKIILIICLALLRHILLQKAGFHFSQTLMLGEITFRGLTTILIRITPREVQTFIFHFRDAKRRNEIHRHSTSIDSVCVRILIPRNVTSFPAFTILFIYVLLICQFALLSPDFLLTVRVVFYHGLRLM